MGKAHAVGRAKPAGRPCAVSWTASLSACGFGAEAAFIRRRAKNPAFAREMRIALEQGYETLEAAMLESSVAIDPEDTVWRDNDPPAMPPMTFDRAMQLLYLHQKEVRLQAEPPHLKRRRGETSEVYAHRLGQMWRAQQEREHEKFRVAEALRGEGEGDAGPHEPPPVVLPDLAQVKWSRADPAKVPHHPEVAVFGGWRIGDLSEVQQALAARRRAEARRRG